MTPDAHKTYEFGPFRLETSDRLLLRSGKAVPLTPKAFEVLVCLLNRRGHLVEKDELMREVWPDSFVEEGNVSRTVWALRQALAKGRNGHTYIETIPKHGYRFVANVSVKETQFLSGSSDDELVEERHSLEAADRRSVDAALLEASNAKENKGLISTLNNRRSSLLIAGVAIFLLGASWVVFLAASKWVGSRASIVSSGTEKRGISGLDRVNPEARDAYMDGQNAYNSARNMSGAGRKELFLKAVVSFDRAINLEPYFIDAHSGLVESYTYIAMISGKSEDWEKVVEVGNRILQFDNSNAAAFASLGTVDHRFHWDWDKAEQEFKTSIALSPNTEDGGHAQYALLLSGQGRHDEAIEMMKRAIEADPHSETMKVNLGNIYIRAKQYDKALDQLNKVAEWHPDSSNLHVTRGQLLAIQGHYQEAIAETKKGIELSKGSFWQEPRLAWVYAKAGQRKQATMLLDEFMKNNSNSVTSRAMFDAAGAYAELGESDIAFNVLERLIAARAMYLIWLKVEPPFERLQGDQRYEEVIRRIGLK